MADLNFFCLDPRNVLKELLEKAGKKKVRVTFVVYQNFSKTFHNPSIYA